MYGKLLLLVLGFLLFCNSVIAPNAFEAVLIGESTGTCTSDINCVNRMYFVNGNVTYWDISTSTWLINDSGILDWNETLGNSTYVYWDSDNITLSENVTAGYFFGNGSGLTDVGGSYTATNPWMVLTGSAFSWNDTLGNETYQLDIGSGCTGSDVVVGVFDNGTLNCSTPGGSGDITAVYTNGSFLYGGGVNGELSIYFNETLLNQTIGENDVWVNESGDSMTGNLTSSANVTAGYFFGNGSGLTDVSASVSDDWVNESGDSMTGNLTVNANVTAYNFFGNLSYGYVLGTLFNSTDEIWLHLLSGNVTFNETLLNSTIDDRDSDTLYDSDEVYINEIGTNFTLNETVLNSTIEEHDEWNKSGANVFLSVVTDEVGFGHNNPSSAIDLESTSGMLAEFRGSTQDFHYILVDADNTKDAGISFQEATASMWTIGNDGGDDSFDWRRGAGVFNSSNYLMRLTNTGELILNGTNSTHLGRINASRYCNVTNCYTIQDFLDDSVNHTDTWWTLNNTYNYLYNDSNGLQFNESLLNVTIDDRDSDTNLSQENVEDFCGGMATNGDGVDFVYSDAGGTLTPSFDCSDVASTGLSCSGEDLTVDDNYVDTSGDTMTGNLTLGDNDYLVFGDGSDAYIVWNGTDLVERVN